MRMEPQFLNIQSGRIFCQIFRCTDLSSEHLLIISPPFADEMNKSRRQIALLARALNRLGIDVLVPDWSGTGDSAGDFVDATLVAWRAQFTELVEQFQPRYKKLSILALRSGALILPQCAELHTLLLWQPVISGELFLNQFLRMKVMAEKMAGRNLTVKSLLDDANNDAIIECAGYQLNPKMVEQLLQSSITIPHDVSLNQWLWLEASQKNEPARAGIEFFETLKGKYQGQFFGIPGSAFWQTTEIEINSEWIDASAAFITGNEIKTGTQ